MKHILQFLFLLCQLPNGRLLLQVYTKLTSVGWFKEGGATRAVQAITRNERGECMVGCPKQIQGFISARTIPEAKEGLLFAYELVFSHVLLKMVAKGVSDRHQRRRGLLQLNGRLWRMLKP